MGVRFFKTADGLGNAYRSDIFDFGPNFGSSFNFDQMNTINSIEYPERPELKVLKRYNGQVYVFQIKGEEKEVSRKQFRECIKELIIQDSEEFEARFGEVCEWFITQTQYIQFEEVKN